MGSFTLSSEMTELVDITGKKSKDYRHDWTCTFLLLISDQQHGWSAVFF